MRFKEGVSVRSVLVKRTKSVVPTNFEIEKSTKIEKLLSRVNDGDDV